jgi:hypothetical protein
MNALSKLLVRVAKRVLANNPSNETMLSTADRVVTWRNADYITDEQVDEIANVIQEPQEPVEGVDEAEPAQESTDAENASESASESSESASESKPLEDMTKAELLEYAQEHGVEVYESWTKAEIIAAIEAA